MSLLELHQISKSWRVLGNVPVADLLSILLAMPTFVAIVGWLFACREPAATSRQAIE